MNKYGLCLDNEKVVNEKNKYKYYCKCGNSAIIYPFEKRQKKYVIGVVITYMQIKEKNLKIT